MRTLSHELLAKLGEKRFVNTALAFNDRAAVCDGLIESRVRGQAYIGLNAVVLSPDELTELKRLTALFGDIMTKALQAIVNSNTEELKKLGWPAELVYPLQNEPPNRWLTPIGRFDFAQDRQGIWQLMEFNSDTPSGSQEVTLVEERLWRFLGRVSEVARLNPEIGAQMTKALWDEALFAPVAPGYAEVYGPLRLPHVGFMVRGRHLTDLAQVIYYAQGLQQAGLKCTIGDPNNLALFGNRVYLLGQPIDALYRLFPIEHLSKEPLFAAYIQANLTASLKCLNNLRGFLAQSKAIMAWVWREQENTELFSAEERKTIQNHLPATYLIQDLPDNFDRTPYIIKEFYGREGSEVYNGAELEDEGWAECQKWGTFVAQSRIEIAPQDHAWVNEAGIVAQGEVFPCVGSFLIGGQWGGCYTRVGGRITTSQAQFVPTLVDL